MFRTAPLTALRTNYDLDTTLIAGFSRKSSTIASPPDIIGDVQMGLGLLSIFFFILHTFSNLLLETAIKGRDQNEFVEGRQMGRDASQITHEDAGRQGWRFANTALDYSPNAAYLASEDGDFRQVVATYDKENTLTFYVIYDDGVILA